MIIFMDSERKIWQNPRFLHDSSDGDSYRKALLRLTKVKYNKFTANQILDGEKLMFLLQSGVREVCPFSLLLSKAVLNVWARAIRQERKRERMIQIRNDEVKLCQVAGDVVPSRGPKNTTGRVLELINKFRKVDGYKLRHKCQSSFYIPITKIHRN